MGDKEAVVALVVGLAVWIFGTLVTGNPFWPYNLMMWFGCEFLVGQASACQ